MLHLNCGFVICLWKRQPNDENVIWIEAEIDRLKGDQSSHEKAGSRQQNQRQGNLADHQKLAEPSVAKPAADAFA